MKIAILVPDDEVFGKLGGYAKNLFARAAHDVFLLCHPAESLSATLSSRCRRFGLFTAIDEAAYSLYEARFTPWRSAMSGFGLEEAPCFSARIEDTRTNELGTYLSGVSPDVLIAIGCTPIKIGAIPPNILLLNVHPGILPRYRGVGTPEAIIRREPAHAGFTVHRLTKRLDDGEIFIRKRCVVPRGFNAPLAYVTSYRAALDSLAVRLDDTIQGTWPAEDDFTHHPLMGGTPLWRIRLTQILLWNIIRLFENIFKSRD